MNGPAAADLQRWSAEVARDPASPAFVPLARAFRRQGRREAALRLCVRGLEHNPAHIEAHLLLALLYLDGGDRERARDEWSIVLRLEPDSFEANRGMAFIHLERREYALALRHLERAAAVRPGEPRIREALVYARERAPAQEAAARRVADAAEWRDGATEAPAGPERQAGPRPADHAPRDASAVAPAAVAGPPPPARLSRDPRRLFEPLLDEPAFLGAMIIDRQGLVLAGTMRGGSGVEALGAVLAVAIDEAVRAARHLALGDWRSILLEADDAVVHMSPLDGDLALLIAVRREAPTGWVLRSAARAQGVARAFLGAEE